MQHAVQQAVLAIHLEEWRLGTKPAAVAGASRSWEAAVVSTGSSLVAG